jgi:hypothetical protein
MIRVEELSIREFRGIRNLSLKLNGKSFAVCGPNGTGKSGAVDAIEFALTGEISRLSGRGTGGLSVKSHGPHVDSRNKPGEAVVATTIFIPSLNKRVEIRRTVKDARTPIIAPMNRQVADVLDHVSNHPEFVLSRRELIRYVLSEPGKRSEELQALLRLDELEDLRTTLQKIANAADRDVATAKRAQEMAAESLVRALGMSKLGVHELLAAANAPRQILGLPPIVQLDGNTSLRDGLQSGAETTAPSSRIAKAQMIADLAAAREALAMLGSDESASSVREAEVQIDAVASEPIFATAAVRESLLTSALDLFDEAHCPVCDTEWDPAQFRQIVAEKREQIKGSIARRKILEGELAPIVERMETVASTLITATQYGGKLSPIVNIDSIKEFAKTVTLDVGILKQLLPIEATRAALAKIGKSVDGDALLGTLEAAASGLPEPSTRDAARDLLTIGQERLESYRAAAANAKTAKARAETARRVFDIYGKAVTSALDAIYKAVEARFVALYRIVNYDDESAFQARLTPSFGKLGFDVDFYGRGFFPPGAYHSEGHQDAMGLCLYLALMDHLLGQDFVFAVLDDVLMSVDAGHRRNVCRMLLKEFPHTQFLLTTHDDIWLRHMKSEGLIAPNACVHFRKWDVDTGPTEWDDRDVWVEIDEDLARNDVRAAAALLRHYLEYFAQESCHRLRARVELRGDAQYTRAAAKSWKQDGVIPLIEEREGIFAATRAATNVDQWQINAAVHFNNWANLNREDFVQVVAAFRELVNRFSCEACGGLFYVSPERGEKETLRCGCAAMSINLNKGPGS